METLIALLILTVLASASTLFAGALFKAPGKIIASSRDSAALGVIDTEFRRACGEVRLAWWLPKEDSPLIRLSPEEVTVKAVSPETSDEQQLYMVLVKSDRGSQLIIKTYGIERKYKIPESFSPRFTALESGSGFGVQLLLESAEDSIRINGCWSSRSIFGETDG